MTITAIEKKQKDRYTVFLDGEYWAILDAEILLQNDLRTGRELDEEEQDDILRQAERRRARERAYYLLGYRDHSRKELYDKLLRSARPEIAREIVDLMEEQGFLNDEAYAQKLAQYFLGTKKWGTRRAGFEMSRRGIPPELAQNALVECGIDAVEQIKSLIEKKYAGYLETGVYKDRQKVVAALSRMGFGFDDIKTAIREYAESVGTSGDDGDYEN